MLSSIQPSLSGLEAPAGPSAKVISGNASLPFDQVMNQALNHDSNDPKSDCPTGQPGNKSPHQKSVTRPAANRPKVEEKPSSRLPPSPDSDSNETGLSTKQSGSRGKNRVGRPGRRSDDIATDANSLAALPAAVPPVAPLAPILEQIPSGSVSGSTPPNSSGTIPAIVALPSQVVISDDISGASNDFSSKADNPGASVPGAATTNSQTQSQNGLVAKSTRDAVEPQISSPAKQASDTTSQDRLQTDPNAAKSPSPDASPPGQADSDPSRSNSTPGSDPGIRTDPHSQFTHGPPPTRSGNPFPQSFGTSVAQQETPMKKAEKTQKSADLSQQNLPGESAIAAGQAKPVAVQPLSAVSSIDTEKVAVAAANVPANSPATTGAAVSTVVSSPVPLDPRLISLERTHDLVAMHALRVNQSGQNSLTVVLEPGGGTRLSLDLRLGNSGIEAQALLHRGDFQFLNGHWAELQQRLQPRGIQLGDLKCSDQSDGGQQRFQQSGHQSAEEQPTRSAFAEFAFDGSMSDSAARRRTRTKNHAGWETWA